MGDLNVAASQKDCHYLIKHEKCYNAEELALLSALTSRRGSAPSRFISRMQPHMQHVSRDHGVVPKWSSHTRSSIRWCCALAWIRLLAAMPMITCPQVHGHVATPPP